MAEGGSRYFRVGIKFLCLSHVAPLPLPRPLTLRGARGTNLHFESLKFRGQWMRVFSLSPLFPLLLLFLSLVLRRIRGDRVIAAAFRYISGRGEKLRDSSCKALLQEREREGGGPAIKLKKFIHERVSSVALRRAARRISLPLSASREMVQRDCG